MAKKDDGFVSVNVSDFQRTRDSVIVALATLQSSVQELSRAYINHANTVLAPGRVGALDSNLTTVLTDSGLLTGQAPIPLPNIENPDGEKKKRKRQPHDPNAPKRALTPYFLYMQHARAKIHKELGEQARPKEVADEGTRRWGAMSAPDKSIWDDMYQKNLAAYRVRMAAYKAGQPVPSEDEAAMLVEAGKAPENLEGIDVPNDSEEEAALVAAQIQEAADETSDEEEVEVEEETPEPEPEPSPPKSKRRKSEKTKVEETPKETPKSKSRKAKKEPSPVPVPAKTASQRKKTRKG